MISSWHLTNTGRTVGGLVFLPGTNRAADRFARASFLLNAIPRQSTRTISMAFRSIPMRIKLWRAY